MSAESQRDPRVLRMLVTIAVLGAIVYGLSAALVGRPPIIRDAFAYNASAQRLLNTGVYEYDHQPARDVDGAATPTAFTMPGYTVFLAGIYALLPHSGDAIANMLAAQLAIIVIQLLLATACAVLIAYAGVRLGGLTVGWTSGGLAVAYVPFGMNATVALTETLALALMSVVVLSVVEIFSSRSAQPRHSMKWWVVFGVFGGLSTLVRPTIALWLLLPIAVWLWTNRSEIQRSWRAPALAAACIACLMVPWVARNAVVLHRFVPLTDSVSSPLLASFGGTEFDAAEEAVAASAEAAGKDPAIAVMIYRAKSRPEEFVEWKVRSLRIGLGYYTHLPFDILLDFSETGVPEEGKFADARRFLPLANDNLYSLIFAVIKWYHRFLLLMSFVGLALLRRRRVAWVLGTIPVYYVIVHMAILFMVRYFYPAMPAVILLAAVGVVGSVKLAGSRAHARAHTTA